MVTMQHEQSLAGPCVVEERVSSQHCCSLLDRMIVSFRLA